RWRAIYSHAAQKLPSLREAVTKLLESPGGTYGNSPAIHRWVSSDSDGSPVGTTEYPMIMCVLPSLPGLCFRSTYFPPMNRWLFSTVPAGLTMNFDTGSTKKGWQDLVLLLPEEERD